MTSPSQAPPRRRLAREQRTRQLLDVAWILIGQEGSDALTLGRLAEAAGVTKPVVYDHFGTRNGLLAALYEDYDMRQTRVFDAAVDAAPATRHGKANVIACSYVDCVLSQGHEISSVLAALSGSPELAAVKRRYQAAFIDKCRGILAPFVGNSGIPLSSMWAVLGAADALADAAALGEISRRQACEELEQTLLGVIERSG